MPDSAAGSAGAYLEQGKRWVFACALEWPGWCRRGRSEELALETLTAYAPRYAEVARRAGLAFLPWAAGQAAGFAVTERLTSPFGADFGAPTEIPDSDATPVDAEAAERMAALASPSDGTPPVAKGWPARYAARRIAWHALDHAWEIEDRSEPSG